MQFNNCSRESKSRYLLFCLQYLVALQVFEIVEVGFGPLGHTHDSVDKCISQTSDRLRYHDTITLWNFHYEHHRTNKVQQTLIVLNASQIPYGFVNLRNVLVVYTTNHKAGTSSSAFHSAIETTP